MLFRGIVYPEDGSSRWITGVDTLYRAVEMVADWADGVWTIDADKHHYAHSGDDTHDFLASMRELGVIQLLADDADRA